MEQVCIEVGDVEFIVEAAQSGEDHFGEFRLEAAVKGAAEEDTAASGSELPHGAVVIDLEGASAPGEGFGVVIRVLVLLGEVEDFEGGDIESVAEVGEAAALAAIGAGGIGGGQMFVEVLIYMRYCIQILGILPVVANPLPGGLFDRHFGIPAGEVAVADGFDVSLGIPVALIDTGAGSGGLAPGGARAEVFFPEGPGAALERSLGIDLTDGLALSVFLEEDAVFAGLFFDKAIAETNAVGIFSFELVRGYAKAFGHTVDFFYVGPDVSFTGSGATAATHLAGKGQSGFIPGIVFLQALHVGILVKRGRKFNHKKEELDTDLH